MWPDLEFLSARTFLQRNKASKHLPKIFDAQLDYFLHVASLVVLAY
jgi:hypothetical protein